MTYEACLIMVADPIAKSVGLSVATCQRPTLVAAPPPPPPAAPRPAVTMTPIPNPVPVQDGERG
jgi:hypothetical protein